MNDYSDYQSVHEPETARPAIAGLRRRALAFFVDTLVLGLLGLGLGAVWAESFAAMGPPARTIGFGVAWLYFGLQNSQVGGGQTLGKRLLGIRVVRTDGGPLSIPRAFARYLPLGLPWLFNGMPLPSGPSLVWMSSLVVILVLGLGGSAFYLLLFNRRTRQSVHDLLVDSVVVRASTDGFFHVDPIWKFHWAVCGALVILSLVAPAAMNTFLPSETLDETLKIQDAVNALEWVNQSIVSAGSTTVHGGPLKGTTNSVQIVIYMKYPDTSNTNRAEEVAAVALRASPLAYRQDQLVVKLMHGYDIGITSSWRSQSYSRPPGEWVQSAIGY